MCGFAAVLAIATALYHQHRTGEALRVRTSLAAIGGFVQLPFAYQCRGQHFPLEPSGRNILGYHALSRFYQCSDGWIFMDAEVSDINQLSTIFKGITDVKNDANIVSFLKDAFLENSVATWIQALTIIHIAVASLNKVAELIAQHTSEPSQNEEHKPYSTSLSFTFWGNSHPSGLTVTTVDPSAVKPLFSTLCKQVPPERYGQSTRFFLTKEMQCTNTQVDSLVQGGIVSERYAAVFLPS